MNTIRTAPLPRLISWLMLGLAVLAAAGTVVLQWIGCGTLFDPLATEPALAYGLLMLPLNGLAFSLLGTLLITYRPGNRFGWLASLYGLSIIVAVATSGYGQCNFEGKAWLAGGDYALWLNQQLEAIVFLSLSLLPWLFPDGRFLSPRWQRIGLTGSLIVFVLSGLKAIWPGQVRVDPFGRNWIENPLSLDLPSLAWFDSLIISGSNLVFLLFLMGIASLWLRWRRSTGEMRQQIKWLAFHFGSAGTLFLAVEILGAAFYPAIFNGWFYLIVLLAFWLGLPLVMSLAVFKYRLYDIDLVIRKTLAYTTLTGLLALIYFGSVVVIQGLFQQVAGSGESALAIVASTLGIAALFNPLRRRIQDFIDRRFFRQKYDAEKALAAFAEAASRETDIQQLSERLTSTVWETLQPGQIGLWLKKEVTKK